MDFEAVFQYHAGCFGLSRGLAFLARSLKHG